MTEHIMAHKKDHVSKRYDATTAVANRVHCWQLCTDYSHLLCNRPHQPATWLVMPLSTRRQCEHVHCSKATGMLAYFMTLL